MSFPRLNIPEKINNGDEFCFSRWGDGEWNAVLGLRKSHQSNADDHTYFDDLAHALQGVLIQNPGYYMGMQGLAWRMHEDKIKQFLNNWKLSFTWYNSDELHHDSIKGRLNNFIESVRNYKGQIYIVGNDQFRQLGLFKFKLIQVERRNCWLEYDKVKNQYKGKGMYLFACGMMAEVLMDDWWEGEGIFIDIGSVLDPYCGVKSRTYHHDLVLP